MGIKRSVRLVCDGPCGKVIPDTEKAPPGWCRLTIMLYEQLKHGEKPTKAPMIALYCPDCTEVVIKLLNKGKFSLIGEVS